MSKELLQAALDQLKAYPQADPVLVAKAQAAIDALTH